MNNISVIVTLYGLDFSEHIKIVLINLKKQTEKVEIILAEQSLNITSEIKYFCENNNIIYVHSQPNIINKEIKFNLGKVRNDAAKAATSKFLYFADSDIFIFNQKYFENLLEITKSYKDIAFIRPSIKRLSMKSIDNFLAELRKNINIDYSFLNKTLNCFVDYDNRNSNFKNTFSKEYFSLINNILHTTTNKNFSSNYNPKNFKEFKWTTMCHFGGLFCMRELFFNIGGFSEYYLTYGFEDTDIQLKFDRYYGVQLIDNIIKDVSIIHFEHKNRCENKDYQKNYLIFKKRKNDNINNIILIDKQNIK